MKEYKSGRIKFKLKTEMKTLLADAMLTSWCAYGKMTYFGFVLEHTQSDLVYCNFLV